MADGAPAFETESGLPPPGCRWGTGAQSVLPYLTRSLRSRPAAAADVRELRAGEPLPQAIERERPSAA